MFPFQLFQLGLPLSFLDLLLPGLGPDRSRSVGDGVHIVRDPVILGFWWRHHRQDTSIMFRFSLFEFPDLLLVHYPSQLPIDLEEVLPWDEVLPRVPWDDVFELDSLC